jgi:hypothetical protein
MVAVRPAWARSDTNGQQIKMGESQNAQGRHRPPIDDVMRRRWDQKLDRET